MHRAKCIKLLSALLGFFLLLSFFPLVDSQPISANPDRLKWSVVDTPSEEGNVVVSPSEINAFVAGQNETFYAIDIPNGTVYKSTDAGVTWENITDALVKADAELPAWDIAVAPDNSNLVAVVTDNRTAVYLSDDGGEKKWENSTDFDLNGTLISDIAISPKYKKDTKDTHDIAIGTRYPNNITDGDVWVLELRPLPSWKPIELNMDVSSVAFSPGYGEEDGVILAIGDRKSVV